MKVAIKNLHHKNKTMIVIICRHDGKAIPIMNENDSMATFDTQQDAEDFAESHMLCVASETSIIDLDTGEMTLL